MQAARGTSLSDDDRPSPPGTRRPRRTASLVLFVALAATWYAADQVTKGVALDRLADRDVVVWDGVLTLNLVRNPGAAFGTGTEYTVALTCFAIAAALVVLWIARRLGSLVWATGLGLLLAGVLGNLTDRMLRDPGPLRGEVIDFLQLPSWPVFNLADIAINVAAGLILVQAFRNVRVDGRRVEDVAEEKRPPEERPPEERPSEERPSEERAAGGPGAEATG